MGVVQCRSSIGRADCCGLNKAARGAVAVAVGAKCCCGRETLTGRWPGS